MCIYGGFDDALRTNGIEERFLHRENFVRLCLNVFKLNDIIILLCGYRSNCLKSIDYLFISSVTIQNITLFKILFSGFRFFSFSFFFQIISFNFYLLFLLRDFNFYHYVR